MVQPSLPLTLNASGPAEALWSSNASLFDIIYNVNMIHISPWSATAGLMKTSGERLKEGGVLIVYGPFAERGVMCESNKR